jgi:dethiobiotin synthetase
MYQSYFIINISLTAKKYKLEYLIFNGDFPEDTERVICNFITKETKIIKIPEIKSLDKEHIKAITKQLTITKL